jgi:signal transduction histidine kinase
MGFLKMLLGHEDLPTERGRYNEMAERERSHMSQPAGLAWERWGQALADWIPYIALAISTILSLIQSNQTWTEYTGTFALVALAAAWVFFMYTRAPTPRHAHRVRMFLYFVGLLVLAAALMSRQPIFFVFMITGFFHASVLRPWWLAVLGVAVTSILINTIASGFPWPDIESWFIFIPIIVIQILAIGFGSVMGERLAELSEQRRQAVTRLEAALEENSGLQSQLLVRAREAGILEERQRMAREIHDTLAQGLIGIITQLEAAQQAKDRTGDWQRHLDHGLHLARESLAEARRSVNELRPEPLESAQLPDALAKVAQNWSAVNDLPVEVTTTGDPLPLHPEIEVTLLRTAQEALANIAKHAKASRVGLTLSYMGDVVTLDVRDNGVGFDVTTESTEEGKGLGLTIMRQRVNRVAGSLEIESVPGDGTAISARVPVIPAQMESLER